ncbi:MAG: hypothetical protein K2N28_04105 [Muribaculaceae bacterium]|nr:hypothetical protein [Muribaculaceae bacterium]
MQITQQQHDLLGSLLCHRLSSVAEHRELVKHFENQRNPNLIDGLRNTAWSEDEEGSTAYYIIKSSDGVPLFFFSLKCGALYQHLDEVQIKERKKAYNLAKRLISNPKDKEEEDLAAIILEQFRAGKDISDADVKRFIRDKSIKKRSLWEFLSGDKSRDPNKHIIRVENTHSGIELVHFCSNDLAREKWKKYALPHPLGKVIFWYHIVPIIQKVRDIVGCKYLFLFAADGTEDGTLINYYNVELKLKRPDDIGTSKPIYDFNCVFMCSEINDLLSYRTDFLLNFNPDNPLDAI